MKRILFGIFVLLAFGAFYEFVLVAPPETQTPPQNTGGISQENNSVDNPAQSSGTRGIIESESQTALDDIDKFLSKQNPGVFPSVPELTFENGEGSASQQTGEPTVPPEPISAEETSAVREYLIASSDLGFDSNTAELQLALMLAENGEPRRLLEIIKGFEERYRQFIALIPPKTADRIHEESLKVLTRYIAFLKDIADRKEVWESLERASIIADSETLLKTVRGFVAAYKIELPPDIIPSLNNTDEQ